MNLFSATPTPRNGRNFRILVACEESQTVCKAFRAKGFEAYSCDILPCSGGKPEWHLHTSVWDVIGDGWDVMVAHPECTRLTVAANRWYAPEYAERFPNIHAERKDAIEFFMRIARADIPYKAIENPVGIMSTIYRKPSQIIQPWQYGSTERKATALWLEGLPLLKPTKIVEPDIITHASGRTDSRLHFDTLKLPKEERRKARSVTFPGIAEAMAEQWGKFLTQNH